MTANSSPLFVATCLGHIESVENPIVIFSDPLEQSRERELQGRYHCTARPLRERLQDFVFECEHEYGRKTRHEFLEWLGDYRHQSRKVGAQLNREYEGLKLAWPQHGRSSSSTLSLPESSSSETSSSTVTPLEDKKTFVEHNRLLLTHLTELIKIVKAGVYGRIVAAPAHVEPAPAPAPPAEAVPGPAVSKPPKRASKPKTEINDFDDLFRDKRDIPKCLKALKEVDPPLLSKEGKWIGGRTGAKTILGQWLKVLRKEEKFIEAEVSLTNKERAALLERKIPGLSIDASSISESKITNAKNVEDYTRHFQILIIK